MPPPSPSPWPLPLGVEVTSVTRQAAQISPPAPTRSSDHACHQALDTLPADRWTRPPGSVSARDTGWQFPTPRPNEPGAGSRKRAVHPPVLPTEKGAGGRAHIRGPCLAWPPLKHQASLKTQGFPCRGPNDSGSSLKTRAATSGAAVGTTRLFARPRAKQSMLSGRPGSTVGVWCGVHAPGHALLHKQGPSLD